MSMQGTMKPVLSFPVGRHALLFDKQQPVAVTVDAVMT
jgi:hypothetical protein